MSGIFSPPNEDNEVANIPVFASAPTLIFTPCSIVKIDGNPMMVYRLSGGLSTIQPLAEAPQQQAKHNQMLISNSSSNLNVLEAAKQPPVSGTVRPSVPLENIAYRSPISKSKPGALIPVPLENVGLKSSISVSKPSLPAVSVHTTECRSPVSMIKPSILRVTNSKNCDVKKRFDQAIEDSRKPFTRTIQVTAHTQIATTNDKMLFNSASKDVRKQSDPTTGDAGLPLTVSRVWTLAVSKEQEQVGSPLITSKPSIVSVADLKNVDVGCSLNTEKPTPVLCVANANISVKKEEEANYLVEKKGEANIFVQKENNVVKKDEEVIHPGGHNALHACSVPEMPRAKKRKISDSDIQSLHKNNSSFWPCLTTLLATGNSVVSNHDEHARQCSVLDESADKYDEPLYTHISPTVRALLSRKLKGTSSDKKDVGTIEKQDERAISVNETEGTSALNHDGLNFISPNGMQTAKSFSESLVSNYKNNTFFTTIQRPEGFSMARIPHITQATTSSIDQQQPTSGNPLDGACLSSHKLKSPISPPRKKPYKVFSVMKIKLPESVLLTKQLFSSKEMKPSSVSSLQTASVSSGELDRASAASFSHGTLNRQWPVNTKIRPEVKFESLLGQCRVVVKKIPFKGTYYCTKRWKKYVVNDLSKRQRRACLRRIFDRPYAIRRNPTVTVL